VCIFFILYLSITASYPFSFRITQLQFLNRISRKKIESFKKINDSKKKFKMQRISFIKWIYLLLTNSFRLGWLCLLVKIWFDQRSVNEIVPEEYNLVKQIGTIGRYIFLTHLNQVAHKVAFFALLCSDLGLIQWERASKLFQSYVIPQSTTTFVIYWALYMKDPSLVRNPKTVEVSKM